MKPTNIRKSEDYTMVTGDHKNILPLPPPSKKKLPPYPEIISNCTCFMSYQHIQYGQTLLHSPNSSNCMQGRLGGLYLSAVSFRMGFDCNYKSASLIQPRALADPNPPPATTGNHPIRSIIIYTSVMYLAAPPFRFVQELPPSVHYPGGCLLTGHPPLISLINSAVHLKSWLYINKDDLTPTVGGASDP